MINLYQIKSKSLFLFQPFFFGHSGAHSMTFNRIENEHVMLQLIELLLFCSPLGEPAIDLSQLKFMWCDNAGCCYNVHLSQNNWYKQKHPRSLIFSSKVFFIYFFDRNCCVHCTYSIWYMLCMSKYEKNIILVFVHLFANGMAFLTCLRCYTHE